MKLEFTQLYPAGRPRTPCHLLKRPRKHAWEITIRQQYDWPDELFLVCNKCQKVAEIDQYFLATYIPTDDTMFSNFDISITIEKEP